MRLTIASIPMPLAVDSTDTVRVGGTRVTLDTIVSYYNQGQSPEEVVNGFPTVKLADVYATIAYYLNCREEVDEYLRRREEEAEALRREIEARSNPAELRRRLRERWAQRNGQRH